ncbi:adenylyl-sulfate kinase (plasmid) [Methylobacterium radiotolerans]|jgi:bifunctional enzyme CysN/CysC
MPGHDYAAEGSAWPPVLGELRFITCGSVDDGKSTLIGRLLYDCGLLRDDQVATLEARRLGGSGPQPDFAFLLDALEEECEQGITVDVAYRAFATVRRAFVAADAPGHEQYTRNMATAASQCDLAIILIDASRGVQVQTRRHAAICGALGIRHVILAINKIDLIGHDCASFDRVAADASSMAVHLKFGTITAVPISARDGDNVAVRSPRTPWYRGPTLVEHLESIDIAAEVDAKPMRLPVQWINRLPSGPRGIAGTVASGTIATGDKVVVAPTGAVSTISRILGSAGEMQRASAGDAVTVTLADEVDVARGDLIVPLRQQPDVAGQFTAHLLWLGTESLQPGRSYLMRIGHRWMPASVTAVEHRIDWADFEPVAAQTMSVNEIAVCTIATALPVAFDPYAENHDTGAFIFIDQFDNETVAAGMILSALPRAAHIRLERLAVSRGERALQKGQQPTVLWFTGLPASGKSTIARLVDAQLTVLGRHTYVLDGDNLRHGICRDLGFSSADRAENVRRAGEIARIMADAGLIVLCAFISPFRTERQMVRDMFQPGEFMDVFINTPLAECIRRDPKGLYEKARAGRISGFTGVDSPYEPPEAPDLVLSTMRESAEALADHVIAALREAGRI